MEATASGRVVESGLTSRIYKHLDRLSSLRLTLVAILALFSGVCWAYLREDTLGPWPVVVPLALLALNLLAAIVTRPVFRRQVPLLSFHLGLLALVLLIGIGRMTYLDGWVEILQGSAFEGRLHHQEQGPWHFGDLESVRFVNEGFVIDYKPGLSRGKTFNRVRWTDESGAEQTAVIGDHYPLVLNGYRFLTTFNKGFAPVFEWQPSDGGPRQVGAVHLPSYPLNSFSQTQSWTPPDSGAEVWMQLDLPEEVIDPEKASLWKLPETYSLVVRVGETRHVLEPGDAVTLADGRLKLLELRSWMGYSVTHDWTLPWLFGASTFAVISLGWHLWRRVRRQDWREAEA